MKKLLVFLACVTMVLSSAAVSMAASTSVNGDTTLTYNTDTEVDSYEANLKVSAKISDQVSANANFKANNLNDCGGLDKSGKPITTKSTLWTNEAYTTLNSEFGQFKFGMFEYIPYNTKLFDKGDAIVGKLKTPFAIGYTSPVLDDIFTVNAVYFVDQTQAKEYDTTEATDDGAGVFGLGVKTGPLTANLQIVKGLVGGTEDNACLLNVAFKPTAPWNLWVSCGQNENKQTATIIGGEYLIKNCYLQAEYDLDVDLVADYHRYAYRVGYDFKNGIKLEYRYKAFTDGGKTPELRLITTF